MTIERIRRAQGALALLADGKAHRNLEILPREGEHNGKRWRQQFFLSLRVRGFVVRTGNGSATKYQLVEGKTLDGLMSDRETAKLLWPGGGEWVFEDDDDDVNRPLASPESEVFWVDDDAVSVSASDLQPPSQLEDPLVVKFGEILKVLEHFATRLTGVENKIDGVLSHAVSRRLRQEGIAEWMNAHEEKASERILVVARTLDARERAFIKFFDERDRARDNAEAKRTAAIIKHFTALSEDLRQAKAAWKKFSEQAAAEIRNSVLATVKLTDITLHLLQTLVPEDSGPPTGRNGPTSLALARWASGDRQKPPAHLIVTPTKP